MLSTLRKNFWGWSCDIEGIPIIRTAPRYKFLVQANIAPRKAEFNYRSTASSYSSGSLLFKLVNKTALITRREE